MTLITAIETKLELMDYLYFIDAMMLDFPEGRLNFENINDVIEAISDGFSRVFPKKQFWLEDIQKVRNSIQVHEYNDTSTAIVDLIDRIRNS